MYMLVTLKIGVKEEKEEDSSIIRLVTPQGFMVQCQKNKTVPIEPSGEYILS